MYVSTHHSTVEVAVHPFALTLASSYRQLIRYRAALVLYIELYHLLKSYTQKDHITNLRLHKLWTYCMKTH